MEKIVSSLIKLEESEDYSSAKEIIMKRKNLRKFVRESLEKKEKLPNDSGNYAGYKLYSGAVSYKSAVEQLGNELKVSESRMEEIIEENRGEKRKRIFYGRKNDLKGQKHFDFDSFEYFTPEF